MHPRRNAAFDLHDHSTLGQGQSVLGARVAVVTSWQYGATGLGVLADRAAIQAAIDALTALGGGTVDLPPGTYLIDSPGIILKNNVTLRGHGDQTILVPVASAAFPIITSTVSVPLLNARVSALFVNGDGVSGLTSANHGIQLQNPTRCHVDRCRVRMVGGHGITFPALTASFEEHLNWITHNLTECTHGHGIALFDNNSDTQISSNEVGGSGYAAFPDPSGYGAGSTFDGIHLENTGGSHKLVGNHVHQSSRYNINLAGAGDSTVTGNLSEKSAVHGIVIQSSDNNAVSGNLVRQVARAGATSDGIYVTDCDANVITGNRVKDGRYGVSINRTAGAIISNNVVVGNNCAGITTAPTFFAAGGEHLMNSPSRTGSPSYSFRRVLNWQTTVALPSLVAGASGVVTLTVPGAIMGDPVLVGFENIGANAIVISAQVTANDTVKVVLHNVSGGTLTYGTQTWRAVVFQI